MLGKYTTGLDDEVVGELATQIDAVRESEEDGHHVRILCTEQQVKLTLTILRHNPTQMMLAEAWGVSQATVSRSYRKTMPQLREVLRRAVPSLREITQGRLVLVDGTDVPTGHRAGQDGDNYSGKRRRQGLLVQVAADTRGRLLGVSQALPGRTHDRRAFTEPRWERLLADRAVIADPAYQGSYAITPISFGGLVSVVNG